MVLHSPSKAAISLPSRNIYGTPRIRKPLISKATPDSSPNTLTFLSPQASLVKKKKLAVRSHRISDLINCISGLENLEMIAEPASQPLQTKSDSSLSVLDYQCQLKGRSLSGQWNHAEKRSQSEYSNVGRGKKRKSLDDDCKEDVIGDPRRWTSYFHRSIGKRRKLQSLIIHRPYTIDELEETYRMVDHWQEEMFELQTKDWEYKRKYWVDQCHTALWCVLEKPEMLEKPGSEMFPEVLLPIADLTCIDIHWLRVLVHSARVKGIASPEFSELTHDPRYEANSTDEEFEFQIQFEFGFDLLEIEWCIHAGIGNLGMNRHICHIIGEFIGRSKFICDVQIYYKKSASPWWEQDGIAKMKYWSNGEYIDMIEFSADDEVYFVREWPKNNLVIDDYNGLTFSDLEDETPHMHMEKMFITAVCCQIIHICVWKTPPTQSCAARNVLKQLSMIMKGWFIGVLLGEGLNPEKVTFEYDARAPCLMPAMGRGST